jgi:hypothetical protein
MQVTLAETPNSGDMEPQEVTSCNQAGSPEEGWEHQLTYKPFDSKFVLSKRSAGMEQRLKKKPTNNKSKLKPI